MAEKLKIKPMSKEELIEVVEELSGIRGRHTELVSVLVPAKANINIVIDQLEAEKSTARNIKSKTTQKNVIEALERATRQLRLLGITPKNGVAIYSGNVSSVEGQEDMRIWIIEPSEELTVRLYRCDQVFILDPLKEMLEVKELYGLFVIERKEATIGLLEGKKIKILQHLDSGVPGKVRAGGQSAARYSRITEGKAKDFYNKGEYAKALDSIRIAKQSSSDNDNKQLLELEETIKFKMKEERIEDHYKEGMIRYRQKEFAGARKEFEAILSILPE